jgi:nitroreductase
MKLLVMVLSIIGIALGLSWGLTEYDSYFSKPQRVSFYPVLPLILHRSSKRAMSGQSLSYEQIMTLCEAARWAPSSYNGQPWRLVYAQRGTPEFQNMLELLVPFNQQWAQHAGVLIAFVSCSTYDHNGEPCSTHAFDTGAAWENLALQAHHMNLVARGMSGFYPEKAREVLKIPQDYEIHMICAVGWPGDKNRLPEEMHVGENSSDRKILNEIVFEGTMAHAINDPSY